MEWYTLDENQVSFDNSAGIYVLKNLNESEKDTYWNDVHPKLLNLFDGLPFDVDNNDLLINRSVTEYEVKLAVKKDNSQDRILWFYRKFSGGVTQSDDDKHLDYNDTIPAAELKKRKHYYDLLEWMQEKIPSNRIRRFEGCSYESYSKSDSKWTGQFDEWCNEVSEVLSSSLQNIIKQRKSWDEDGCGLGILVIIIILHFFCYFYRDSGI